MRCMVVVEKGDNGYGAYVPDLPGCIVVAETEPKVLELIQEAIELHLESMREDGEAIPEPTSSSRYVEVSVM